MGAHWWKSESFLNFSNFASPELDAALEDGRQNDDEETRFAAYSEIQSIFSEQVPFLFIHHTRWAIATSLRVHGVENGPLPDGSDALPMGSGFSGTHRVALLWVDS
jgi:ABC-type transport system substrate-binding protein